MKTIPGPLQNALNKTSMSIARLVELTRVDGVVLYFTDYDQPLEVSGNTYIPGLVDGEQTQKDNLAPAAQSGQVLIDSSIIKREDLETGLYDNAIYRLMLIDSSNPAGGVVVTLKATTGTLTVTDTHGQAENRGIADRLRQSVSDTFKNTCSYDLGDITRIGQTPGLPRCKVDLAALTVSSEVTAIVGTLNNQFDAATLQTFATGYFRFGQILWSDGPNAGRSNQIKEHTQEATAGRITLEFSEPYPIAATHKFQIAPGCKKDRETCRDKFNNINNFGGFPFIPGQNKALATGN